MDGNTTEGCIPPLYHIIYLVKNNFTQTKPVIVTIPWKNINQKTEPSQK